MIKRLKKIIPLIVSIYKYNVLSHFKPLAPLEMQINITYRCNSHCQMCHIWQMKPQNELSFREWQGLMKDPIFLSIRRLIIAGGEPTLHPKLINLCNLFIKSMPKMNQLVLVTNGFLPQKTAEIIKNLALLCHQKKIQFNVSVSLDGIGKIHDVIRGVKGAYKKATTTILDLKKLQKKYQFYLSVGGVVCRPNLAHIEKVEKWCQKHSVSFNYQLIGFHQSYVNNLDKKDKLDFSNKDKKHLFSLLNKLAKRKSFGNIRSYLKAFYWYDMLQMYKQNQIRKTPCPFIYDAFVLDSLGDVYYCLSEKKIGNWCVNKSISEIYYDPKKIAFRKQMTKTVCLKCNSGCFTNSGLAKDFKKFFWFLVLKFVLIIF